MIKFEGKQGDADPSTHAGDEIDTFPGFGKPFPSADYREVLPNRHPIPEL